MSVIIFPIQNIVSVKFMKINGSLWINTIYDFIALSQKSESQNKHKHTQHPYGDELAPNSLPHKARAKKQSTRCK